MKLFLIPLGYFRWNNERLKICNKNHSKCTHKKHPNGPVRIMYYDSYTMIHPLRILKPLVFYLHALTALG